MTRLTNPMNEACDGLCKFKRYDEMCERCKLTDSRHHDDHDTAQYPADCRLCAAEWRASL